MAAGGRFDRDDDADSGRLHLILGTDALVEELFRLGWGPWLTSLLEGYGRSFSLELYSSDSKSFSKQLGIPHHPLGPPMRLPRLARWIVYSLNLVLRAPRMKGIVRLLSPNLAVVPEIRRLSGSPVIVDFHYDWATTARAHYGGLKKVLSGPVQMRCLRGASLIVATTRELKETARTRSGVRSVVIPNFVDNDLFRPRARREEKILFAGRMHWAKGVGVLIMAFARIADAHPGLRLVLLGSGEEEKALRDLVPEGLRDRVLFGGSRPMTEVAGELGSARIAVLPTLTSEGHPRAVIEAMACGTPIICSGVPGLAGLIQHERTGLLVPPGDEAALAEAISRLITDSSLWQRISDLSIEHSRRYAKGRVLPRQMRVMRICREIG